MAQNVNIMAHLRKEAQKWYKSYEYVWIYPFVQIVAIQKKLHTT